MMRVLPILTSMTVMLYAVSTSAQGSKEPDAIQEHKETMQVFHIVEENPEFPGGTDELFKFLATETKYPDKAKDAGISGVVYVQFIVDTSGEILKDSVTILQGVHPLLDEEAMRVVRAMPAWRPGFQKGKPVRVYYKLPFRFTLQENKRNKSFCGNFCAF